MCSIAVVAWLFSACGMTGDRFAGYVEGEFSALAPTAIARITALHVRSGDHVEAGDARPLGGAFGERRDAFQLRRAARSLPDEPARGLGRFHAR